MDKLREQWKEWIGRLTRLQTLKLVDLGALEMPGSWGGLTGLTRLTIYDTGEREGLAELLKSRALLTGLQKLTIVNNPMAECMDIRDIPASMEALTALRHLKMVIGGEDSTDVYETLARYLPSMRLLEGLHLCVTTEEGRLAIGRCLRAWPPPHLREFSSSHSRKMIRDSDQCMLRDYWRVLGLPEEAAEWKDMQIVEHFREQQSKVAAFASGLHRRLGAGSVVSQLDEQLLVLIADEVLGGLRLMREWREEGADQKPNCA